MKVKELIVELQKADPEKVVVASVDEEGNGFGEISDVSLDNNVFVEGYPGEVHIAFLTPELEALGFTEEDVWEDGTPAVVLWP